MSGGVRGLAVSLLLVALAGPAPSWAQQESAEALATRLLAAPDHQRAQLLARDEFASVDVARALIAAGNAQMPKGEFKSGVVTFHVAQAVAERVGAQKEVGQALVGAALCLLRLGDLKASRREMEQGLHIAESVGDLSAQAEAWNGLGGIEWQLGNVSEAEAGYRKALPIWEAAGDRRGVARAVNNVALVQMEVGDLDGALEQFERALHIFEELDDRLRAATVTNTIGTLYLRRGQYALAREYCERSLAMRLAVGDRNQIASSLNALGPIYKSLGAYARALEVLHRALKIDQLSGEKWPELEVWNNIGEVHFAQGDYDLAIDAYKRTLRLNAEMGGHTQVGETLNNIAAAAWRMGDPRRAEANYREGLRLSEREGQKDRAAVSLQGLGRIALEAGRLAEARPLLQRALAIREGLKDQAGVAETLSAQASLDLAQRRPQDALSRARRAVETAGAVGDLEDEWRAETIAGLAYRQLGQLEAAQRSLEQAVAKIEGLRLQVAGGERAGTRFLDTRLSPYHELMALALGRGKQSEALEVAERAKARALADLVHRGRVDISAAMSPARRKDEERLRGALATINARISAERLKEAPDAARLSSLEEERKTRRATYEAFEVAMEAEHPELGVTRGHAAPFTFAEASRVLEDDRVAVLEYVLTEEDSHLFVLTREKGAPRVDSYALGAGRAALADRARRLRTAIAARDLAFTTDARALHDLLLAPARARLQGRNHLIVVPDGALWEVPFQALVDPAGHYVIESAAVAYAPSLTVLRETVQRPRGSAPSALLAMGKADFGAKGAPPAIALMSDLGPLPDAERQVRSIAALYGPDRSTLYVGAEAREDRFKAEAPRYSILHLATHGVLDESSPLYSHVVLSPGAGGSSEDGLLEAWELMDLKLKADLVILSACETGRGRIAPGEGIVGTMWAAFVAGAQALLVSQWKVESASTTELMTAFHAGLLRGDGSKAAQLQRASLALLRQPRYAHPFYWAGFVLVGNPY